MKPSERQNLLRLVEALIEGVATSDDIARLEEYVLQDKEARRLYVEVISLHGELYWDAAGAGSTDSLPTNLATDSSVAIGTRPETHIAISPNRRRKGWRILVGVAVTSLLIGVMALSPILFKNQTSSHVAQSPTEIEQQPPAGRSDSATAESADRVSPVMIPDITLPSVAIGSAEPRRQTESKQETGRRTVTVATTDVKLVQLINAEIRRVQSTHEITPVAPATDSEWVRRVYLDLAGRIPTLNEVESFLKEVRAEKRTLLVDQLLSSPGFAHHQATIWTNLLVGRTRDQKISRDDLMAWLGRQFRENRPWRDTVEELIAAVGTESDGPANFLLAHLNNQAVPATAIASRILLCRQLQCVQCHEHPTIKGWGQEEFWEFNAFFQQTRIKETVQFNPKLNKTERIRELVNEDQFGPTYYETLRGVMLVAFPRYGGVEVMAEQRAPLRDQLARLLFTESQPQAAKAFVNRTWAQFFGYGFTTPLDDMGPHTPVSHPELLEQLTAAFVASGYDVKKLIRCICLSDAYHAGSQIPKQANADSPEMGELPLFSRMYVKSLTAEQLYESLRIASGAPEETLLTRKAISERERWLAQFYQAVETEENSEESTFDGTLPLALVMMNGDLVQGAVDPASNPILNAVLMDRSLPDTERIRKISLAALSRYPSSTELHEVRDAFRRSVKYRVDRNVPPQVAMAEAFKDVYWAYLNSSEFAVNH